MATLRLEHWERLGSSARASVSNKDRDILCSKKKNLRKSSLLIKSSAWKNWLLMHIRSHSFSFIFYCTHHTHTQPSRGCGESLLYTTPPPPPPPLLQWNVWPWCWISQWAGCWHDTKQKSAVQGILVMPSGHFSQYQHHFAFQDVGIGQEQYYGTLKQGWEGEPIQRKIVQQYGKKNTIFDIYVEVVK